MNTCNAHLCTALLSDSLACKHACVSTNLAVRYHPARVVCLDALNNRLCYRIIVWCVQDVPAGGSDVQIFLTRTNCRNSIGSSVLLQAILCTEENNDIWASLH